MKRRSPNTKNTQREAKRQGRWLRDTWIRKTPRFRNLNSEPPGNRPVEPNPANFIAANLALGVAEILEIIFLNLDMMHLLMSVSRVSRLWHVVVNDTPSLRRILHFDPEPAPPTPPALFHGHHRIIHSYSFHLFSGLPVPEPLIAKFIARGGTRNYQMWSSGFRRSPPPDPHPYFDSRTGECRQCQQLVKGFKKRFAIPGASWRRMFVSQPPPAWVYCVWGKEPESREEDTRTVARIDALDADGLRLVQLHDFVQSLRNNNGHKQCYEFVVHLEDLRCSQWRSFENLVAEQLGVSITRHDGIFIEAKECQKCHDCKMAETGRHRCSPKDYRAVFRCQNTPIKPRWLERPPPKGLKPFRKKKSTEVRAKPSPTDSMPDSCASRLPKPGRGFCELY